MIPDEAVEAAEQAVIDAMIKHGPDGHIDGYQEIARAALEAAARRMLAEAWESGFMMSFSMSRGYDESEASTRPVPESLRVDLDGWNPYRSEGDEG